VARGWWLVLGTSRFATRLVALGLVLLPASAAAADVSIWQWIGDLFRPTTQTAAEEVCQFRGVSLGETEPAAVTPIVAVIKKAWERELGGEEAARPYVLSRLVQRPSRLLGDPPSAQLDDRELVAHIARDTWRGLDAMTDRTNGLPINNIRLAAGDGGLQVQVGDYAGTTDIGLSLIATAAAYELELISEADAVARIDRILRTLAQLESYEGFFYNFYDTTSMERTSNFVSFVDSSWLTAGLIVVRSTFPSLRDTATRLIDQTDYRFFYDDDLQQMSHGYYVNSGTRSRYHYGVLYAESRLGSLIAIGKGDAPEEHWFAMTRTFPAACEWQRQTPHDRHAKEVRGYRIFGGWYEWNGLRYVPSWGGSMFEALMPRLLVDERRYAPLSLGRNGDVHAEVQRRYATESLGYPVWGLSPSSAVPSGYTEYGAEVLGSAGYKEGVVTPHATALALMATPADAVANLRRLLERYQIYGEYGLYDAVDPQTGEVAHTYLTLDQAMSLIAMTNYLKDGCLQKLFAADPIVQQALPVLSGEDFLE